MAQYIALCSLGGRRFSVRLASDKSIGRSRRYTKLPAESGDPAGGIALDGVRTRLTNSFTQRTLYTLRNTTDHALRLATRYIGRD